MQALFDAVKMVEALKRLMSRWQFRFNASTVERFNGAPHEGKFAKCF